MKKYTALAAFLTAACSSAPVSFYYGVAPPGRETAYQCGQALLANCGVSSITGPSQRQEQYRFLGPVDQL